MKTIGFILITLLSLVSFGQHSTLNYSNSPIQLNQQSLLLVPFEGKMYSSDINKKLAETNDLTSQEIIKRFTQGIDQSILYTFQKRCNVSSFYQLEDDESKADLNYIYDNLNLEYELVSNTLEKSKTEKLKAKFKKKQDNSYQKGKIENGQIVTQRDDRKRYMKAVVTDNKMLDSMHFKFDNKFFLFVNQLDIRNDFTDLVAVQQGNYDRNIEVHYTLYSKEGEILTTGISTTSFPNTQNDINQIIKNNFPILAQNIFDDLFETGNEEEGKTKLKLNKLWK